VRGRKARQSVFRETRKVFCKGTSSAAQMIFSKAAKHLREQDVMKESPFSKDFIF
jgi:hypothetical protein